MTTELRTQFLNFMTVERFSDHTKRLYLRGVIGLVKFYNQSPDTLTNEQIQEYFSPPHRRQETILGNLQQLFFRHHLLLQKCL